TQFRSDITEDAGTDRGMCGVSWGHCGERRARAARRGGRSEDQLRLMGKRQQRPSWWKEGGGGWGGGGVGGGEVQVVKTGQEIEERISLIGELGYGDNQQTKIDETKFGNFYEACRSSCFLLIVLKSISADALGEADSWDDDSLFDTMFLYDRPADHAEPTTSDAHEIGNSAHNLPAMKNAEDIRSDMVCTILYHMDRCQGKVFVESSSRTSHCGTRLGRKRLGRGDAVIKACEEPIAKDNDFNIHGGNYRGDGQNQFA
ncbi:hypothetical protein BaRGS_00037058, partial [Batillaria attramentaria]